MDSNGAVFIGSLFGMLFATVFLGAYVYVVYLVGRWLGMRASLKRPMWVGILAIVAVWQLPSIWPYLTDWHPFMKLAIALSFFLLNAYPMAVAYGAAIDVRRDAAKRRFRKNVDDWLGDWECEPAHHGLEDEGDSG